MSRAIFVSQWLDKVVNSVAMPMIIELINQAAKLVDAITSMTVKVATTPIPVVGEVEDVFSINDFVSLTGTIAGGVTQLLGRYLGQLTTMLQSLHEANAQLDNESIFLNQQWPVAARLP